MTNFYQIRIDKSKTTNRRQIRTAIVALFFDKLNLLIKVTSIIGRKRFSLSIVNFFQIFFLYKSHTLYSSPILSAISFFSRFSIFLSVMPTASRCSCLSSISSTIVSKRSSSYYAYSSKYYSLVLGRSSEIIPGLRPYFSS